MSRVSLICRKFSSEKLPNCNFVPKPYKGPPIEELIQYRKNNLVPGFSLSFSKPVAFYQGHKQWLFDIYGKRYLDMYAGICTVSVGHSHPKISDALYEQVKTLGHISNCYLQPKIHEYANRLTDKLPGDLKVVYFTNSGSEANELAVLLARLHSRNFHIISLKNCYHGMTYLTSSMTSNTGFKYPVPQATGLHKVMNPDPYRGLWGGAHCRDSPIQTSRTCSCSPEECQAGDKYIEVLEKEFEHDIPKNTLAGMFAESIQGVGGTVQFPKNYIKKAYELVKNHGGLFVSDEVQTGFGRTGDHFWGFQMHEIIPDIVTMAKGIGNGYPLGAVVTTPEIARCLDQATLINTFGGNPIACTVGISVLDIIEEEKLQENAKLVGTYLLRELESLKREFPIIGDVRGKGLMIGVELVKESDSICALEAEKFLKIWEFCKDNGLILGKGGIYMNVIRIKPPLCVTKEDVDFTLDILQKAFREI